MLLLSIPRVKQSTYHPCAAQPVSWVACACAFSQDGGAVRKLKSVWDQRGQKVIKQRTLIRKRQSLEMCTVTFILCMWFSNQTTRNWGYDVRVGHHPSWSRKHQALCTRHVLHHADASSRRPTEVAANLLITYLLTRCDRSSVNSLFFPFIY